MGAINMAESIKQKLMKASDIPAFVDDVIRAGCGICAVGQDKYVLGDGEAVADELDDIENKYGERDFLKAEIAAYLRSIGRCVDVGADGAG
jgi:hypothetical protein